MIKKITLLIPGLIIWLSSSAQSNAFPFPLDSLERLLVKGMNNMRRELGYDTLESNAILKCATELQAYHMTKSGKAETWCEKSKYENTGKRLIACGGAHNGEEIVLGVPVTKGKDYLFAKEVAATVIKKWKESKKERPVITNGNYTLYAITVKLEEKGKTAFISVVFSNYNLMNDGVKKRKELKTPFTSKNKKIKPPTPQACKSCDKFKDYDSLRSGLYINEEGYICIKYYDKNALKKIFKRPTDGIAVDIIQRAQYEKPGYNIYNNNLLTKGILIKPISGERLFRNNIARYKVVSKGKKEKTEETLNSRIGKFPKNLKGEFEMNLIILQDGQVCKTIKPRYVETGSQKGAPCEMLLMPDSAAYLKPMFEPKSESGLLNFRVPFEKNKYEYKEEDIKPLLDSLQEPDFTIEGIYVTAYSSIEGDSAANAQLQKNRANSIIEALNKNQKEGEILTNVITRDSWLLFTMEMEDGKYDYLTKMSKHKAIHEINTKPGLAEELEPFLAKERFAELILDVTYDITGPKEERFCISKFNSAIKRSDMKQAAKIQYYIEKNIDKNRFSAETLDKLIVPKEPTFAGIYMNALVYDYFRNKHKVTEDHFTGLKELATIDPSNSYIRYNYLFCKMQLEPLDDNTKISKLQAEIDMLYQAKDFPKRYVDALNTEFQFEIMAAMDTIEGSETTVLNCINKIKSFYSFKKATWQNSLKLAYTFMKHKEFSYSADLLQPFIQQSDVNEEVLFTFISACSNVQERLVSKLFVDALRKAHEINATRYCNLFGEPNMSFQVLDIPQVKEDYMNYKCKE